MEILDNSPQFQLKGVLIAVVARLYLDQDGSERREDVEGRLLVAQRRVSEVGSGCMVLQCLVEVADDAGGDGGHERHAGQARDGLARGKKRLVY